MRRQAEWRRISGRQAGGDAALFTFVFTSHGHRDPSLYRKFSVEDFG
jgi:hypothetical protein